IPLLVVAGIHARDASTRPAAASATVTRPDIAVDPQTIPPVPIRSTGAFANALTAKVARQVARDVIADLVITRDALRRRDPALAATAADGQWLDTMTHQISDARRTGTVTV